MDRIELKKVSDGGYMLYLTDSRGKDYNLPLDEGSVRGVYNELKDELDCIDSPFRNFKDIFKG